MAGLVLDKNDPDDLESAGKLMSDLGLKHAAVACVRLAQGERRRIAEESREEDLARRQRERTGMVIAEHWPDAEVPAIADFVLFGIRAGYQMAIEDRGDLE